MAQGVSGYVYQSGTNGYQIRVHYDEQYDIESNQSTITVYADVFHGSYAPTYADGIITVNGASVKAFSAQDGSVTGSTSPNNSWSRVGAWPGEGTYTVNHNQDGTGSMSIGITANHYGGFQLINAAYSYTHDNFGIHSWNITLTTIPRASSVSASNIALGSACSVSWIPNSTAFAYKVKFAMGDWSTTTSVISPGITTAYTYSDYVVPLDVASQIPNATSGTMTATLYTYSDASCSTQLGVSSCTFTVSVPDGVKPSISSLSASIVNSNSVINGWGVAVSGYTKVRITADASGAYGSTISSFSITGGYTYTSTGTSLDYTGPEITSSGLKSFTVTCKDSRGRVSAAQTTDGITFYAYVAPIIQAFGAERSSSDNSKIIVRQQWSYATVNGENGSIGVIQYKQSGSSAWSTYEQVPNGEAVTLSVSFDTLHSYNIRLVVLDYIGNQAQAECFVSTMDVLLDFRSGGKGLGVGKICETDAMEVMLPAKFLSDVYIGDKSLEEYIRGIING